MLCHLAIIMVSVFSHHEESPAAGLAKLNLLLLLVLPMSLTYAAPTVLGPRDTIKVMIVGDSISQGRKSPRYLSTMSVPLVSCELFTCNLEHISGVDNSGLCLNFKIHHVKQC